jgi:hypothetical protein
MGLASGWITVGLGTALFGLTAWTASCSDPVHIELPTSTAPTGQGGQTSTGTGGSTASGGGTATTCESNTDCAAPTAVCDTVKSVCVECLVVADCQHQPGTVCSQGACACPTAGESWCEPDVCVDLETSPDHCGQCGHPCFGACAGGACVDEWEPTATENAPIPRFLHTAVWTDSVMIVWGGATDSGMANNTNTGAMYDPAAYEWVSTSVVNVPSPRRDHTAVWTGSEMIVWGGRHASGNGALATGGRFDPATNTWQTMAITDAPAARYQHTSVWTGSEMIVWGGVDSTGAPLKSGASYDPANDSWTTLNQPGTSLVERTAHSALWNGSLMLAYGGRYQNAGWVYLPDTGPNNYPGGLQYNPSTSIWSTLQPSGQPDPRGFHTAVMLGSDMVVWGGYNGTAPLDTGARYDTTGLTWSATNPPQPEARYDHTAVVLETTPEKMVIWGGMGAGGELDSGGIYELSANTWEPTATALTARTNHTAVSTGTAMIVWGGQVAGTALGDGGVFTPQ